MPSGTRLTDGFPTLISFANAPNIALWEISVKPPGFDGTGPNDTTTMRNTEWRTMQPKRLKTLTPMSGKCAYDPKVLGDIDNQMNVNQLITITFPSLQTWAFWGYLDKFEPDEIREGTQPEAGYTIQPTNQNNSQAEVAPAYGAAPTTTSTTTTTL